MEGDDRTARERGSGVGYDTRRPLRSLYETAREVILRPRGFFERLPPEYDCRLDRPVWFAAAVGVLTAPLFLITLAFDPLQRAGQSSQILDSLRGVAESQGVAAAVALALFFWLISPVFVLLSVFIGAALVTHTHLAARAREAQLLRYDEGRGLHLGARADQLDTGAGLSGDTLRLLRQLPGVAGNARRDPGTRAGGGHHSGAVLER